MRWERALVTGASSGIGAAFARQLASEGTSVVAVARREAPLRDLPGDVEVLVADLATPHGLSAVEDRLTKGDITLLVNNAGFGTSGRLAETDAARVADEISVDVVAVTRLTRAVLASLVERGEGGVLNVSSLAVYQPTPGMAIYGAAKTYVKCFTEALAEELRGSGVQATVLCPGLTRTAFGDVAGIAGLDRAPSVLWQSPETVARAGLDGLARGQVVVIPGAVNRVLVGLTALVPRPALLRLGGALQRRGVGR